MDHTELIFTENQVHCSFNGIKIYHWIIICMGSYQSFLAWNSSHNSFHSPLLWWILDKTTERNERSTSPTVLGDRVHTLLREGMDTEWEAAGHIMSTVWKQRSTQVMGSITHIWVSLPTFIQLMGCYQSYFGESSHFHSVSGMLSLTLGWVLTLIQPMGWYHHSHLGESTHLD